MQTKYLLCVFYFIVHVNSSGIEEKVIQYFKSDIFKAFQKHWQAHRKPFENAILLALKENYGVKGMNVYVRRSADTLKICTGFYGSDNVIDLLLSDMVLTNMPLLTMPEVVFALASNVIRLEAALSKIILMGKYMLFRNQTDVVYSANDQTTDKSPFSYLQVQPIGQLAIIADDCTLYGYALTKLSGHSINLGHDTFRIRKCKFSVEISSRLGEPPVIASYFSDEQSKKLENLLSKPIRQELMPKLQAALFSYINTSLVFGDYLPKFREYQNDIFKETSKHMKEMVRNINIKTVHDNQVTVEVEAVQVTWRSICPGEFCSGSIIVHNVTLFGLDTLYSSHTGGPYKLQTPKIAGAIRFNSLMVRGNIVFENNTVKGDHEFVAEINDVTVNVEVDVEKSKTTFEVLNWRSIEFSIIELERNIRDRNIFSAYVHGYLTNKLPELLKEHISRIYEELQQQTKKVPEAKSNQTICV